MHCSRVYDKFRSASLSSANESFFFIKIAQAGVQTWDLLVFIYFLSQMTTQLLHPD